MIKWIKEKLIKYHEDRALQHFKHLCQKYKTGVCPKKECSYFLQRNPFRTKACTEEEVFETCPLIDFSDVVLAKTYTKMKERYTYTNINKHEEEIVKR